MKLFTFSNVPAKLTVEQLAQYQRRELEQVVNTFQKEIERLEQELETLKTQVNESQTN